MQSSLASTPISFVIDAVGPPSQKEIVNMSVDREGVNREGDGLAACLKDRDRDRVRIRIRDGIGLELGIGLGWG